MRKLALGDLATIEDILEFVPKGMELSFNNGTKIKYDLDFYNSRTQSHKNYANNYFTSHFPTLTFIPGFVIDHPSEGKEIVMAAWYNIADQKITKLPIIALLKRKQL